MTVRSRVFWGVPVSRHGDETMFRFAVKVIKSVLTAILCVTNKR
ncbi:hypothetical protein dsmv_1344 [Desulfococcus multivorans DSM 2059]|uniref:Uncharacterized protein n=1 Tax=Desulfococcus multivorans DSM 2059 TaxID=1121405 RepID=S7VFS8_DESML|nr:uncharacterized protein Dmul_17610 [Desulfococcus multivorans]EPR43318.1 hypothetical protein dsmv_1344 [Desulfococcus multivorans DSM 2059]SJZ42668.1 hypothetical protein SAMN02745446_00460 [Desulfococcus multivorans DSM 2059]